MCEVRPRQWRDSLRPSRVALAFTATACVVAGARVASAFGIGLLGVGAALALAVVLLPVIREVEFGLPVGVKITTAVRGRHEALKDAFDAEVGELHLYSLLLLGEPATAAMLLEAAMARTASAWRGPVTPDVRDYIICVLVQLVSAQERWREAAPESGAQGLMALPLQLRVAVVLHEFATLPIARIGEMTGRSPELVHSDLRTAEAWLAHAPTSGAQL